jgi:hypothetical protein
MARIGTQAAAEEAARVIKKGAAGQRRLGLREFIGPAAFGHRPKVFYFAPGGDFICAPRFLSGCGTAATCEDCAPGNCEADAYRSRGE